MCAEVQVKWPQWYVEPWFMVREKQWCWSAAQKWSGMPHLVQAEAKINPSKNTEVACWKSKWQIVCVFLNFLPPSHSITSQCGTWWSYRRTLWYSKKRDVTFCMLSQSLVAGSSSCVFLQHWACMWHCKMSAAFLTPSTALASVWFAVMWAGRKCSPNKSIINTVPVL